MHRFDLVRDRYNSEIVLYSIFMLFFPFAYRGDKIDLFIWNYILLLGGYFFFIVLRKFSRPKIEFLLSPLFLFSLYLITNFLIGAFAVKYGLELNDDPVAWFNKWKNIPLICFYYNIIILINLYLLAFDHMKTPVYKPFTTTINISRKGFILAVAMLAFFLLMPIDLSAIGGAGNFSVIPQAVAFLYICAYLYTIKSRFRYPVIIFLLLLFASFSFNDKRSVITLILPVLLLELERLDRWSLGKLIFTGTILGAMLLSLIISMSILRGYGDYGDVSYKESLVLVPDYVKKDLFIRNILQNLEISYTFLHSNNAIEIILNEPEKVTYGSTIIKPLFIGPLDTFGLKPRSIIDLYTSEFSTTLRSSGESRPVNIAAEFFWNFHFAAVFFYYFFAKAINLFYRNLIKTVRSDRIERRFYLLFIYVMLFYLLRGSGFDLFIIYTLIALAFSLPLLVADFEKSLVFWRKRLKT